MAWVQSLSLLFMLTAYLRGVHAWVYEKRLFWGLAAVLLAFPLVLHLARLHFSSGYFFMALPLAGIAFFVHRYRYAFLRQRALLAFNGLSIGALLGYHAFALFRLS